MKKILIAIIVLLVGWCSFLTYRIENLSLEADKDTTQEIYITENNVNGFSTDLTRVIEKLEQSVVTVLSEKVGSGFIYKTLNNDVYILTNAHILDEINTIYVVFDNGAKVEAQIAGQDEISDVALLKVMPDFNVTSVTIGNSSLLKRGEWILAVGGINQDFYGSATVGIVSGYQREASLEAYAKKWQCLMLETDAKINSSNTGGPLINMSGEVIGIASTEFNNHLDSEFFTVISSDELALIAESLLNKGTVNHFNLGLSMIDISTLASYQKSNLGLSLDRTDGLFVRQVEKDSMADEAGILEGDILVAIKDTSIVNLHQYRSQLYGLPLEEAVPFTVLRNGNEVKVEFTFND